MTELSKILLDSPPDLDATPVIAFLSKLSHPVEVCHGPGEDVPCPLLVGKGCEKVSSAHGIIYHLDLSILAYQYDYSVIPFRTYTHVYGLPETGGPSISEAVLGFNPGDAFPNPASTTVTIPAGLPEGVRSGSLEILDINGRKVLSYPLTESTGQVQLPTRRLAPGTYLYQIIAANRKSEAKKIVIR